MARWRIHLRLSIPSSSEHVDALERRQTTFWNYEDTRGMAKNGNGAVGGTAYALLRNGLLDLETGRFE